MLHNFNKINFTSLKIQRVWGGVLKNVAFQIEKKSGNIPVSDPLTLGTIRSQKMP
jgi:hypothetical protein